MPGAKITTVALCVCLAIALVSSAPTDTEGSTTPMAPKEESTTSTTAAPESSSMAVSSAQDQAHVGNTSFTCYNREVGYYADVEAECKVYHFCMLGDYNGQLVYQRISYLCLNETIFDQQALDCVESAKISAPCTESAKHYDESNSILRKAIIGKPSSENERHKTDEAKVEESASSTTATLTSSTTSASTTELNSV